MFATNLISDPLTLELGEANELAVQFGLSSGGLHGSIFGLYGDNDQNGGYGAVTGYSLERREIEFGLHSSYISDIGASDNLQGVIADSRDVNENVPGWIVSTELGYKDISLIGEYVAARERFADREVEFAGRGAQPSSWLFEAACDVGIAGKEARVVVGYQGTSEALALELPAQRLLAGFSVGLADWLTATVEWARDEDYASKDGGSGEQVSTITVQFRAKF